MNYNYKDIYKLDENQIVDYNVMYDYACKKSSTLTTRRNKEAAIRIYNKLFKNHKIVDKTIHLDQYHDSYDNRDLRLDYYIKPCKYYSFWTETGQQLLSDLFKIEYYIYLASGHDMTDNQTLVNYRKDCDYIFIKHNRTYSFKKNVQYITLEPKTIHSKIEAVIEDAKTANAAEYYTNTISRCKYINIAKLKISYEDRKSQLTCSSHNMSKYASNFENYLCTLYSDPDLLTQKQIKAERKSYQYYMHKFGLHSTNRSGRPSKSSKKINTI